MLCNHTLVEHILSSTAHFFRELPCPRPHCNSRPHWQIGWCLYCLGASLGMAAKVIWTWHLTSCYFTAWASHDPNFSCLRRQPNFISDMCLVHRYTTCLTPVTSGFLDGTSHGPRATSKNAMRDEVGCSLTMLTWGDRVMQSAPFTDQLFVSLVTT